MADTSVIGRRIIHPGDIVPGSVTWPCDRCGATVWIAPSSLEALATGKTRRAVCCCCMDVHDIADWRRMREAHQTHRHSWGSFGRCNCGMTRAAWESEMGH